mmetsp:Transcript_4494/g.8639  ORF Transcript_4494/g.8639 Transcript_4494/m.8639 type:complete len:723 (+) Transcript_4494:342-2510(+)
MPRFFFKQDNQQKMMKSKPTPTSSERKSINSDTSSGPQSSPRQTRSMPAPSDTDNNVKQPYSKTPASILRSGRYKIEVKRTVKNTDGFADDSPYWEAAKRASTQDSPFKTSSDSDREDDDGDDQEMSKKLKAKDLKRKEKQKMKKNKLETLKEEYMMGRSRAKPNFKVGTLSQSESSNDEDDESDSGGEWLKSSLQMNGKRGGGAGKAMFSPSDLSRASTIPPTPASSKSRDMPVSSGDGVGADDDNDNDGDYFHVTNDPIYDNGDDSGTDEHHDGPSGPLSPIHEEGKSNTIGSEDVQELEDNIMDVADKVSMASKLFGADSFHIQDNADNNSDDMGDGDDQGIGFVVASQEESSPQQPPAMDEQSSDDDEAGTSRGKTIDSKNLKKNMRQIESVTPDVSQRSIKTKRGRTKKVRISTAIGGTGYQAGPREYRTIPADEFEDHDDAPDGVRRSKRRKFRPLQFWKNEKIVYGPNQEEGDLAEVFGDMPMVAGVQQAEPTPYKQRAIVRRKSDQDEDDDSDDDNDANRKRKADKSSKKSDIDDKPFDSTKLRKKFDIEDGDTAPIWWESKGVTLDKKVLCYRQNLKLHELPLSKKRSKKDGKVVAKAAQAFNIEPQEDNMPGYICGCMDVPPLGIKDEEGVGPCSQVFNVGDCQPKSVELAIAHPDVNGGNFEADSAKRFLLSKGDMFHIPAGNVYRIQNHSKTTTCTLNWTIIRPPPRDEE